VALCLKERFFLDLRVVSSDLRLNVAVVGFFSLHRAHFDFGTGAFLAGSITRIPDIAWFCRFCAVTVMVDFFMQITFMVALLTLDQRRRLRKKIQEVERRRRRDQDTDSRRNGRDDVPSKKAIEIPEVPSKNTIESSSSSSEDYSKNDDTKDSNDENAVVDQHASFNKDISDDGDDDADVERKKTYDDGADRFWATQYPAFLFSVPGKVFVLCASFTVLALGIVGCVRFEVDMDLDWSLVDAGPHRYAVRAYEFNERHFAGDTSVWIGLYTKHADYYAGDRDMRNLIDGYAALPFVVTASLEDNWYDAHAEWLLGRDRTVTSNEEWLESLHDFLNTTAGEGFVDRVVFDVDDGIVATEISSYWEAHEGRGGTMAYARKMRTARREVRKLAGSLGTVIVYHGFMIWLESFVVVARETTQAMVIAVSVVLVVLVVLLGDLLVGALVACCVADVCICVFGSLYWYALDVNFLTAFFVTLSVGLASDAPAHYCRAYLESRLPTRELRAREALATLGPPVFRGGMSTICGIVICAFCVTWIFLTFLKLLTTILVLALWNGLAFMPVVCALAGPMPSHKVLVHA